MTEIVKPQLGSLVEIPQKIPEILAWTAAHPVDDIIFHCQVPEDSHLRVKSMAPLRSVDGYIAGSAALERLLDTLQPTKPRNWHAGDADLFFLNQAVSSRFHLGLIDMVQAEEKSVDDLLLNFDLPICRVAYNFAYDFWVSAQCLATIHSRRQNVPLYLKDHFSFMETLEKHVQYTGQYQQRGTATHSALYSRFVGRIKKYQERGFGVNWIETDQIIPWVRNRFHYAEWLLPTPEVPQPNT